ncbi:MAG: hypothetical protein LPL00_08330 [Alphaproteobacteria bacterium]|nr:hypothetical protein [Alphaproteobacteria bacterium]MDX5369603.1 hypothetical protein [Alphaproteobacteria bacterium]MDX5464254.1 hypothetical protein [Alphaproteobacteria bacterium]
MRLTEAQVTAVRNALDVEPVEEDNPAMETLRNALGDHTFYLGQEGLFVFEPVPAEQANGEGTPAQLILVAAWTDEERKAVQAVEPQVTNVTVDLEDAGPAAS